MFHKAEALQDGLRSILPRTAKLDIIYLALVGVVKGLASSNKRILRIII